MSKIAKLVYITALPIFVGLYMWYVVEDISGDKTHILSEIIQYYVVFIVIFAATHIYKQSDGVGMHAISYFLYAIVLFFLITKFIF